MRIKPEHFGYMQNAIRAKAHMLPAMRESIRASGYIGDLEKRVRWDMAYSAVGSKWMCDNIYPYANDDHIDTALRSIMKGI